MPSNSARAVSRGALALLVGMLFLSCGERTGPAPDVRHVDESAPRVVIMADGSKLTLRSRGLRVFPASATVVDFVVALAPPERVVALPEQALDYSTVPGEVDAWKLIPRFSSYLAEEVVAAAPDLVIAEPWQDQNTSERLRSLGIEVVVLPEVRTWKEARATLLCVGSLLELESRAELIVRDLDERAARLAVLPGPRRGLRAMCYSNFGSGWSAGIHTTVHEQITLAGMLNAAAENGRDGHFQISFEDLIAIDPDIILVSLPLHAGDSTQGDRGGASARLLETEPSLRGLRAIRMKRIVALPPSLFAAGSHSIVSGAECLARAVDERLASEALTTEQRR